MNINFHPTTEQLQQYVDGTCDAALSIVVAAHCDMCPECRSKVERLNALASEAAFAAPQTLGSEYDNMIASITQLPAAEAAPTSRSAGVIELDGKTFKLPRALHRFVGKTGNWSHLVGKLWQAPIDMGDIGKANFIYMEKGGRVPEHTHRGHEITLVLDGEFGDGIRQYDTGDFMVMNDCHTHTPHSEADEGCLVFSIVDQPLHFTSGLARLLNPFSHLFFK